MFIPLAAHAFSGTRTITIVNESKEEIIPQKLEFVNKTGNIPQRFNNPTNITCGNSQRHWIEEGLAKKMTLEDGRCFMWYITPETGFKASRELILTLYNDYTVSDMLKSWTNDGYTKKDKRYIKDLNKKELDSLIDWIASKEGWYAKQK